MKKVLIGMLVGVMVFTAGISTVTAAPQKAGNGAETANVLGHGRGRGHGDGHGGRGCQSGQGKYYVDANHDGICDNCGNAGDCTAQRNTGRKDGRGNGCGRGKACKK